jgi:hypothetical protein
VLPLLAIVILVLSACAPSVSPQSVAAPSDGPVADVRRLVVVPSGESKLTMPGATNDDNANVARIFGEIAKWYPKAALWGVLAGVVQRGIDWLVTDGRSSSDARQVRGISPGTVVADALTRALVASGQFDQVRTVAREPIGDDRREMDALVRVIVPAWGLVRVREGKPDLMAAYADVRVQIVVPPTSTIVWEHDEDVTHGERLPLQAFTTDSALSRQVLLDVLERGGQRLANELLYARGTR